MTVHMVWESFMNNTTFSMQCDVLCCLMNDGCWLNRRLLVQHGDKCLNLYCVLQLPLGSTSFHYRGLKCKSRKSFLQENTLVIANTTIVRPQVNNREETQPCQLTENWNKGLLSMAPPIRTRLKTPLSQSLPSGSFHKPLILLH